MAEYKEIPIAEPFRIKMVEPARRLNRAEREAALARAYYNPFRLKSEEVYIDIQTDSGTNAMSDKQWAAIMSGDEAYSGSKSFYELEATVKDLMGYQYVIPSHQGRGGENILYGTLVKPGKYIVSNQFFGTGLSHLLYGGGKFAQLVCDESTDNDSDYPFKGNIDMDKVRAFVAEHGVDSVAFFVHTVTNNPGGGQPVSMANIRELYEYAHSIGKRVILDYARFAENAYFIKEREPGYADKSIKEIVKEFCSYSDGCVISCKKDGLVNIGGLVCVNEAEVYDAVTERVINFEGFMQYGGQAGRDMAALAQGLKEVVEDDYLEWRIGQLRYLASKLDEYGVPYLHPVGGHAIYVNAGRVYPHLSKKEFPALAFANQLYLEGGVRVCEMGTYEKGRDPETGEIVEAALEKCRLAIGRRAYTKSHMDYIAEACKRCVENAANVKGMEFVHEYPAASTRYFLSKLKFKD